MEKHVSNRPGHHTGQGKECEGRQEPEPYVHIGKSAQVSSRPAHTVAEVKDVHTNDNSEDRLKKLQNNHNINSQTWEKLMVAKEGVMLLQ